MLLTGEAPPGLQRCANVMDVGMEPDTEFGPTAVENLLSVAAVVYRDLEEAGFTSEEVLSIAEHVIAFAKAAKGGHN